MPPNAYLVFKPLKIPQGGFSRPWGGVGRCVEPVACDGRFIIPGDRVEVAGASAPDLAGRYGAGAGQDQPDVSGDMSGPVGTDDDGFRHGDRIAGRDIEMDGDGAVDRRCGSIVLFGRNAAAVDVAAERATVDGQIDVALQHLGRFIGVGKIRKSARTILRDGRVFDR